MEPPLPDTATPARVMQAAIDFNFPDALVICRKENGGLYVAMSQAITVPEALLLMERAKAYLIDVYESYVDKDTA